MKKQLYILTVLICSVLFCSCVNKRVVISGPAGTNLYTASDEYFGTIGNDGKFTKKISNKYKYVTFLKAELPSSKTVVPFAIDYNKHSTALDWTLLSLGAFYTPWGIIATCNQASSSGELGATYVKQQSVIDFPFTQPNFNEYVPQAKPTAEMSETKSVKTLKAFASQVEGDYIVAGRLTQNNVEIEKYGAITVRLQKVSNTVVSVNVIDSNGQSFFWEAENYNIQKQDNGSFILTHTSVPQAKITIDANKRLTYTHPKVMIDGEAYQLNIGTK